MTGFEIKKKEELSTMQLEAVEAALEAMETSYAPYSGFAVGCALVLEDGNIVKGSNQENMAYPSGTCAERSALFAYGSSGNRSMIKILAVVAHKSGATELSSASPCGACRQVMIEYELKQNKPFEVIFCHDNQYVIAKEARRLLPFHFHLTE